MRETLIGQKSKWLSLVLFFGPLILVFGGCAAGDVRGSHDTPLDKQFSKSAKMGPFGSHEECLTLFPGEKLVYSFQTSKRADFNIHYHGAKKILYPVNKGKITTGEGSFFPEEKKSYCMMWENIEFENSDLSYEYTIRMK